MFHAHALFPKHLFPFLSDCTFTANCFLKKLLCEGRYFIIFTPSTKIINNRNINVLNCGNIIPNSTLLKKSSFLPSSIKEIRKDSPFKEFPSWFDKKKNLSFPISLQLDKEGTMIRAVNYSQKKAFQFLCLSLAILKTIFLCFTYILLFDFVSYISYVPTQHHF